MIATQIPSFSTSALQMHVHEKTRSVRPHQHELTWSMAKAFCSSASSACAADCLRSYAATMAWESARWGSTLRTNNPRLFR